VPEKVPDPKTLEDKDDILGKSDPKDLSYSENSMQYYKHLIK